MLIYISCFKFNSMIKHFSYKYILYLIFISLIIPSDYKNLYLMEFENSSRDSRTDYLRYGLPEIIRMKYEDYKKVHIEYTPRVSSIFDDEVLKLKNGLLLYGHFNTILSQVVVSFNIYDVDNWEEKSNRSFKCNLNDVECIENAFYVCIEEDVMSFYCDYFDCNGLCEGSAKKDCMGVCEGDAISDCKGLCNGANEMDECGTCDSNAQNNCKKDCNGDWGSLAYLNECNVCVEGNTEKKYDYGLDCNGICFGTEIMDCNGVCGGNAQADCQNICEGTAYLNECNVCVEGNTNNPIDMGKDCKGICFGEAVIDECGECDGFNISCSDCFGIPFGKAKLDNCEICDSDPLNDCLQDCNEDWGGEAFINECMVCVGGNTNNDITTGLDCNDICWGTGKLDECGVCDGTGSIYECGCKEKLEDTCDCDGNVIDDCGECGGNGLDLDQDGICDNIDDIIQIKEDKIDNFKALLDDTGIDLFNTDENTLASDKVEIDLFNNYKSYDKISNTDLLYQFFDNNILKSYNVNILEDQIDYNYNKNEIDVKIPIEYSIQYDLFLDLFNNFTYTTIENENGTITIQIDKNNFSLNSQFEEYCALMRYQIVPVLFFTTNEGDISHIHIDSWNSYNVKHISKNINVTFSDNFNTMFSITPSSEYLYFNFDLNSFSYNYIFSILRKDINNYEKMFIKFFFDSNLETNLLSFSTK